MYDACVRLARILVGIFVVAAVIFGAGMLLTGDPAQEVGPPPEPADLGTLDPLVADRVTDALLTARANIDDAEIRAQLAAVYDANGMYPLAETTWRQAIALKNTKARWWYHLGYRLADRGAWDEAHDALEQAALLVPRYPPLYWRRGFWHLEAGALDAAEASFGRAMQADPNDPTGAVGMARVQIQRGAYAEAAATLEPVVERHQGLTYARQLLGVAYQHVGRESDAAALLRESRAGQNVKWPDRWRDDLLALQTGYGATLKRADALVAEGNADAARAELEGLRIAFPKDAVVMAKLGEVHMRSARNKEAAELLAEALRTDPTYFPAHLHLSRIALSTNRVPAALEHANRAIELNPSLGYGYVLRAQALARSDPPDVGGALTSIDRAIEAGQDVHAMRVLRGKILLQAREWAQALVTFDSVIREDDQQAEAWAGAAVANVQLGRTDQARAAIQKAIQVDRENPFVRQIAGQLRDIRR